MSIVQVARAAPEERRSSRAFRHRPRGTFPDYALPDHTGTVRTLSELQAEPTALAVLTKGGLATVTRSLAVEYAARGITGEVLHIDGGRTAGH